MHPHPYAYDCPTCGSAYLSALSTRLCACGQPTGSVALDTCEDCEDTDYTEDSGYGSDYGPPSYDDADERTRRAIRDMHALAVDSHARARLEAQGADRE